MNLLDYIEWIEQQNPTDLHEFALGALKEAKAVLPMNGTPTIAWRNYRVTAGKAFLRDNLICLSKPLLTTPVRVRDTVLHEYAHLYVHEQCGFSAKPHGKEWRSAMRLLGLEPEVTHKYDCHRREARAKHAYPCERCGEIIHRMRPLRWGQKYVHVGCGGRIRHIDQKSEDRLGL